MNDQRELLVELSEKATTIIVKEFSPDSMKIQYNAQGHVEGKYSAGHIETADILQKTDGTLEYEARAIETTREGDVIMLSAKGMGEQQGPTIMKFQAQVTFMTQSKKLNWLNSANGWAEGYADQSANVVSIKIYTIK